MHLIIKSNKINFFFFKSNGRSFSTITAYYVPMFVITLKKLSYLYFVSNWVI